MAFVTPVSVLYARAASVYRTLPGCDVFDLVRDARTCETSNPVVAHPPCRAWGKLKHFAKPRIDERELAIHDVRMVRQCGGVLEHPAHSGLWSASNLPSPGVGMDDEGGWTLPIDQFWFGHRAKKATWLYVVGTGPGSLPAFPYRLSSYERTVDRMCSAERERTPLQLAQFLVQVARQAVRA